MDEMLEEHLEHIFALMRENESFLRTHSEDLYSELVGVINDGIDQLGEAINKGAKSNSFSKSPILYYLNHILIPISSGIWMNVLTGNLPACFMQLRLTLEALVKSYNAGLEYPNTEFFQDKYDKLEKQLKGDNVGISKQMTQLDKSLEIRSAALWGKLSDDWLHARGIIDGIADHLEKFSEVPSWALVIPNNYTDNDLTHLDELRKRLANFRTILREVFQDYYDKVNFTDG